MGFYAPAQLMQDARRHGVTVLPIDVNHSEWDCTLEKREAVEHDFALRLGLRLIVGLSRPHAEAIGEARRQGPFETLEGFTRRTRLSRAVIAKLAQADALSSFGRDRRQALWEALAQENTPKDMPLFDALPGEDDRLVELPELKPIEIVFADYQSTGLTLREHPISFYREKLATRGVLTASQLSGVAHNQRVAVAGIVLLRQRPSTAKGITFVTLEDETGTLNLVLHQAIWQKFYMVSRRSSAWVAFGRLESKYSVIHVVVNRLVDFGQFVQDADNHLTHRSRDFR